MSLPFIAKIINATKCAVRRVSVRKYFQKECQTGDAFAHLRGPLVKCLVYSYVLNNKCITE